MSEKDIEAWDAEFGPNYEFGLDQALIQDIGEFVANMISGMSAAEAVSIHSWIGDFQSSAINDRYIRDIFHWFMIHTGVIRRDELDPDDRRRLDIFVGRCKLMRHRRSRD